MVALTHWLEKTYRVCRTQLFRCVWQILRNQEQAEDAVHAAFVRSLRLHECPENEKGYMMAAVRNAALDLKKREHKHLSSNINENETSDWMEPADRLEVQIGLQILPVGDDLCFVDSGFLAKCRLRFAFYLAYVRTWRELLGTGC